MQQNLFDIQNLEKLQSPCGQVKPHVRRYDYNYFVTRSNEFERCKYNSLCFSCEKVVHDMSYNGAPLCNFCFLQFVKYNFPDRTNMIEHYENIVNNDKKYKLLIA